MKWYQKFLKRGAKAKVIKPVGNHVENLMAHAAVDISQIGEAAGLPVWVDVAPDVATKSTYSGLLWEIEPMGEYLYFLAGDFPKNEKGLLCYGQAHTIAEAHVCFEDDVIAVDLADMENGVSMARQEATSSSDFVSMTVAEITALAHERSASAGFQRHLAALDVPDLHGGVGFMEQANAHVAGPWLCLTWSKHMQTAQGARVTKIIVRSTDGDQDFGQMHDLFCTLIDRYHTIADQRLTGAIRM